jgi:hypothetical protein
MAKLPLLLRLAVPQIADDRPPTPELYDEVRDVLLVRTSGGWKPAIDTPGGGRTTKKSDVETGEDQKDRW